MKWSLVRSLAESRVVASSFIWLFIVPLSAKLLSSVDDVIHLTIFSENIQLTTSLPFSWQLLFFSACCFTIANIIYGSFCPEIYQKYRSYSDFKESGKTLLQVNSAMKLISWDNRKSQVKANYFVELKEYFKFFGDEEFTTLEQLNEKAKAKFDDSSLSIRSITTNNAFYFVQDVANLYYKKAIISCVAFYTVGLGCVALIAIENFIYVAKTFG